MRHPLLALLSCPICAEPLRSPVTLPCGHSICAEHYAHQCPIPSCSYIVHPLSSGAPDHPHPQQVDKSSSPPKVDVTVNKVLELLSRPVSSPDTHDDNPFLPPRDDHHDHSDGQSDEYQSDTSPAISGSRPRKRQRRHTPNTHDPPEQDLVGHIRKQAARQRNVPPDIPLHSEGTSESKPPSADDALEKKLLAELTCEICYMLLYQPVTTPCQHTFCYRCLYRSLDHNTACPLCREAMPGYAYFIDKPCNKLILSLIIKAFPAKYTERGDAIAAEEREARLKTPILIGQLSFPGMPSHIHIFEPKYRLMLRRCLESPNPHFGVMPPRPSANFAHGGDYGTLVVIQRVKMFPDGRSLLETIGAQRFRVLEHGTLDGYTVARIEMLDDFADELNDLSDAVPLAHTASSSSLVPTPPLVPTDSELVSICHNFLVQMRQGMQPWVVQRINSTYGEPPSDASGLSYYIAMVLPINEQEKAKLLPLRTARLRLRLVVHWIEQLSDNWWFLNGCVIL